MQIVSARILPILHLYIVSVHSHEAMFHQYICADNELWQNLEILWRKTLYVCYNDFREFQSFSEVQISV